MKDITLISNQELSEIRRIWREEKHEFDDSLPRIYFDITGQKFEDNPLTSELDCLGVDEWSVLEELCEDPMHLELVARLLSTESRYQTMSRRNGIYKALEQCFQASARPKETAIEHAHELRELKQATDLGDVSVVRKMTENNTSSI